MILRQSHLDGKTDGGFTTGTAELIAGNVGAPFHVAEKSRFSRGCIVRGITCARQRDGRLFPPENLQPFDAFELGYVGCHEGGSEAAGLGGDEEVERADGFASRFQRGTDIGVVQCGFEIEVCEHKEIEKRFEPRGVMRMGIRVLLHAGPKFSGDDHRNAGQLWVG